ncbi:MAG: late competence development ComFB family protein [Shewanella sp.]
MQLEIRNYYEVLLMEMLSDEGLLDELPEDYLADLCCVTLNQLPVRYIRHLVDTYFYEDYDELAALKREIQAALEKSRAFLKQNWHKRQREDAQYGLS